jgi:hypothetical protein
MILAAIILLCWASLPRNLVDPSFNIKTGTDCPIDMIKPLEVLKQRNTRVYILFYGDSESISAENKFRRLPRIIYSGEDLMKTGLSEGRPIGEEEEKKLDRRALQRLDL